MFVEVHSDLVKQKEYCLALNHVEILKIARIRFSSLEKQLPTIYSI